MKNKNRYNYNICPNNIYSGIMPDTGFCFLKLLYLLMIYIVFPYSVNAQANDPANLEKFYLLADSSVSLVCSKIPSESRNLVLSSILRGDYSLFENRIIEGFGRKKISVIKYNPAGADNSSGLNNHTGVQYQIDRAQVKYSDTFRDGWFGSLKVQRDVTLAGSFTVSENSAYVYSGKFLLSEKDTVDYENLNEMENMQLPFTRAEHPSEPLFENLLEPVIAIGAAAAAVYLFFEVRSK